MRLALDTAFSACSVALGDGAKILASGHVEQRRGQAESLVPLVEEVLEKAKAGPRDIKEIVVNIGPGTFAGVRIATSFARAFALSHSITILGINAFEALAGTLVMTGKALEGENVLALIPGKRGETSAQILTLKGSGFKTLKGPETLPLKDLAAFVSKETVIAAGPDLKENLAEAQTFKPKTAHSFWPSAVDLIALSGRLSPRRFEKSVSPFYLRPPDATPQKKAPL